MLKEGIMEFKEEKWLKLLLPEPSLERRGKVARYGDCKTW